ncbi:MAG: carbohydrate kinase family protein [Fimbriimonadales bacterium]
MILVFGTICLDRVRRVPHMPEPGGYVEVISEQFVLGGEAANTACALKEWGAAFVLAGNGLGEGPMSDLLRSALQERGLAPGEDHIVCPGATPVCDVFVSDSGERTMIGLGFSAMRDTVDPSKLPFVPGERFTAEPNMGEVARDAVRLAHAAGMKTYTMDFVDESDPVYPGSFWQASTDWAGARGDTGANVEWVRRRIAKHGCFSILSDGSNGFVAGSPDLPPRPYPPYPLSGVVDATGAGDLFRAGMLFGIDQAWPIGRCLQFASAAGCLACRSLGATTSIPSRPEIEALIAANPEISREYERDNSA